MAKVNSDVVKQELTDFKEEVIARLSRIENKVDDTNGKIAKATIDISNLQQAEKNCPAKIHHSNQTSSQKVMTALAIINFFLVALVFLKDYIKIGG